MEKKLAVNLDRDCSMELMAAKDTVAILSSKWKIQLITTLNYSGPLLFMELVRLVKGIAPKMLSKELHDLEINLLVKRTVQPTRPVTVEYELTPHGKTLERIINEMRLWGKMHRKHILERQD
jgi:DNA-binding HxlR family transcriptional regulator